MSTSGNTKQAEQKAYVEEYRKVRTILVSQPKPERSPYYDLEKKYGLTIDWRPFIHVEGVIEKEFRKQRIKIDDYGCVIFTSKNAIENYFRLAEETRAKISPDNRYFCVTEAIANYLQKFIIYRKRKVFVGKKHMEDLHNYFMKYKSEKFLLPLSNLGAEGYIPYLQKNNISFTEAMMYKTLSSDLSDLADVFYDVLIFFSPQGIESLFENFPDFEQKLTRMAVFGSQTLQAVLDKNLHPNIQAPTPEAPSMSMALEQYLQKSNG
ncbi:MAG TPA: uroporphyrinogen-III synthase [Saprospiraceae bacterium]|nr:uroporphyrinogen-III synthase [Saprospiraceae bacterium]HPN70874.1 uroporphyrinogen-III synthase [Saprospiraceae bacterium]